MQFTVYSLYVMTWPHLEDPEDPHNPDEPQHFSRPPDGQGVLQHEGTEESNITYAVTSLSIKEMETGLITA
jgi:hypothetical protein